MRPHALASAIGLYYFGGEDLIPSPKFGIDLIFILFQFSVNQFNFRHWLKSLSIASLSDLGNLFKSIMDPARTHNFICFNFTKEFFLVFNLQKKKACSVYKSFYCYGLWREKKGYFLIETYNLWLDLLYIKKR